MAVAAEGDDLCSQAGSGERNVWPQLESQLKETAHQ